MSAPTPHPCSICGTLTGNACSDCLIDRKMTIYVCFKEECRAAHLAEAPRSFRDLLPPAPEIKAANVRFDRCQQIDNEGRRCVLGACHQIDHQFVQKTSTIQLQQLCAELDRLRIENKRLRRRSAVLNTVERLARECASLRCELDRVTLQRDLLEVDRAARVIKKRKANAKT